MLAYKTVAKTSYNFVGQYFRYEDTDLIEIISKYSPIPFWYIMLFLISLSN